ncbi:MAG: DHH family phosphoesterase [Clostridia bacterium]|nr:DHH family phosphoesterase [Clostridia bacterium]
MSVVYVTGHRNPDLDSVCSAYAYAALKNRIDSDNKYIAVRCGHLNSNAKNILASLEITPPPYKRDIFPKVSDVLLNFDKKIEASTSLSEVADTFANDGPSAIPVYDNGTFCGLLSVDDISSWVMSELNIKNRIERIPSIKEIMKTEDAPLSVNDMFTEAKEKVSVSKKRGLSVFDGNEFAGFVTRRCFLETPRHNVILVDHNEPRQSIRGIETANIVEIIDHHRLDAVKTDLPIFIDAEPLGSTCTIVYQQYKRHDLIPDKTSAKMMLTGLVSDTLILRSPTTTPLDKKYANELAILCDVDLQEFGISMFKNTEGLKNSDPETAISADFKTYTEGSVKIGIGQCEVTTLHDLNDYDSIYLEALETVRTKNGLDWAVLMITDVLSENSVLLCTDFRANNKLLYSALKKQVYDMPGVMSRKKQLLPEILHAISM